MVMEGTGQHNLSIALRHILQQIVDSNNPNGHKNTDMTLPHDGYIQKLSWYFECDKCHYKAFYSHEMECHKHACAMSYDFKSFAKKRKTAAPKRVSSTTHPPTEDSDQDSQPAVNPPPVPPPLKPNFGMSRPMASPTTSRQMSTVSSMPSLKVSQDSPNMVSMEPSSIEFDSEMINPDYIDTPTIPEIDTNSHKTLDFDAIPSRDTLQTDQEELQEQQDQQIDNDMAQPQGFDFDPDILEIKVEVEEGAASSQSTSVKEPLQDPMLLPTDIVFPNSDPSVDSMMSIFSSQPTTQPLSTAATSSTTLSTPSSVPMFKKLPSRPELPFGNIPGIKIPTGPVSSYPNIQSLPHQQHRQHSQQHQQHHQQSQQHQLHQHSQPHQQYPAHHQQQSSAASSYKGAISNSGMSVMSLSDNDFVKNYAYPIKRLLLMDDRVNAITHTKIQQSHFCPFERNEEGKKVYTATNARNFLYRIASIGFGNVTQGRTKKITFTRNRWLNLNSFCKQILAKLGISESMWSQYSNYALA